MIVGVAVDANCKGEGAQTQAGLAAPAAAAYPRSMRRLPLPFVLSTAAVAWSAALVAVAYLAPVYSGESDTSRCTAGGGCASQTAHTTATLVEMNGDVVLVIIAVLAGIAALGWLGLHRYCASGSRLGLIAGWAAAIAVAGFSLISFGMGILTLPMAIMMIVAAAMTPRRRATTTT